MKKIIAGIILTLFTLTLVAPIVEAKSYNHSSKKHVGSYVKKNGKVVKGHTKTVHKKH